MEQVPGLPRLEAVPNRPNYLRSDIGVLGQLGTASRRGGPDVQHPFNCLISSLSNVLGDFD